MLFRMLLALMLVFQAMPVAAAPACHEEMAMAGHHQPAPQDQAAPEQHCIGCIAPATARAPELAPPLAFARADVPPVELSGAKGIVPAPALPPPRPGA